MPPDIGEIIHRDQPQLRLLNNKLCFSFQKETRKKKKRVFYGNDCLTLLMSIICRGLFQLDKHYLNLK